MTKRQSDATFSRLVRRFAERFPCVVGIVLGASDLLVNSLQSGEVSPESCEQKKPIESIHCNYGPRQLGSIFNFSQNNISRKFLRDLEYISCHPL